MVCPFSLTLLFFSQWASAAKTPGEGARRRLIINGAPVKERVPWQAVALNPVICGGVIISKNLVLTAAHCKKAFDVGATVRAGVMELKHRDDAPTQKRVVAEVKLHPKYTQEPTKGFDVALVRVTPDFDFSDATIVTAAHLPFKPPSKGEVLRLTGVGKKTDKERSHVLREGTAEIVNCLPQFAPNLLCAVGRRKITLGSGDSGGPASVQKCGKAVVVGVASVRIGKGTSQGGAFADVFTFREWIEETWKGMSGSTYPPPVLVDSNGKCAGSPPDAADPPAETPPSNNPPVAGPGVDTPGPGVDTPGPGVDTPGPGVDTPVAGTGVTTPGETSSGANSLGNPGHIAVGICCFFCIAAVAWYFVSHRKSAGPRPIPHAVGKPRPPKRRLSQQSRKRRPCKTTKRQRQSATSKRGRRK